MRTTVGPLPSSVYWRRRAVVLGAALLGIIVLFVSCSGGDDKGSPRDKAASNSSSLPTPGPASKSPSEQPSFVDSLPGNGPALPDPHSLQSQQPGGGNQTGGTATSQLPGGSGTDTNVNAANAGSCPDNQMSVTPVPSSTTVRRGAAVDLTIKIKNTGSSACSRDVGADPQELYLNQGARKYWSSDDCSGATGHDVRQFAPGVEREYKITWNGRESSACASGAPSGPTPPDGQFQLRARLGTLVSNAVTLTFVG